MPEGKLLFSGDDNLAMPTIAMGGDGIISVIGNILPVETRALVNASLAGRRDEARKLHARLLPLIDALFLESNPAPLKAALGLAGWCADAVRLPLAPCLRDHASKARTAAARLRDRGEADGGMTASALQAFYSRPMEEDPRRSRTAFGAGRAADALESGEVGSASRSAEGEWSANAWVKLAILAGFRSTGMIEVPGWPGGAVEKSAYPPRHFGASDGVRIVPGGSSVRGRAHGERRRDHAARLRQRRRLDRLGHDGRQSRPRRLLRPDRRASPPLGGRAGGRRPRAGGARPVVIEDDCFVGALCGLFEGVLVRSRAVLAAGTVITASTTIYDLVKGVELRGELPEGAVVVPGSRPARGDFASSMGISLYAPCIVKYRDGKTDAATVLEAALR